MAFFSKNTTSPVDQAFARGQAPDNKTLGPNAPAKYDPKSFTNMWASKLFADQPDAKGFYDKAFSSDNATAFQDRIKTSTDRPSFADPKDQSLGEDFLAKYIRSPLLNEDEKVNREALDPIVRQQPSEGVGTAVASDKMKYPGTNSTAVS